MFSGFFGKDDKSAKTSIKEALDTHGLEVIENDPDTTWGLWDSALAEQDSRHSQSSAESFDSMKAGVPTVSNDFDAPTQPMDLDEKTPGQRKEDALAIVDQHHHRIAHTIRTMWGYKECSSYISKLIMNAGDGTGRNRVGFNQDAAEAMMLLSTLHDQEFGEMDDGIGTGLGGLSSNTGWDKLR